MAARECQTSLSCYTSPHGARTKRRFQGRSLDSVCSANSRCRVYLFSEVNRAVLLLHPLPHPCLILGSSGSTAALGFPSCLGHGFGFFKDADSHVAPTSYPGPQSAQVTRLSSVKWSGTANLLLPHLRHLSGEACMSALIGSGMTLRPFWLVELPHRREETNQG